MNCDPENNDQEEASKPSSSEEQKKIWSTFINYQRAAGSYIAQVLKIQNATLPANTKSETEHDSVMLMSDILISSSSECIV